MIGNLAIARNVLETRRGVRKDRGHQIVGEHALQLRRDLLAGAVARDRERQVRVPAPACLEHWRVEKGLDENVARRGRMQVAEHVGERKRMLRPEREKQAVFGGRRLQLEIELAAEALAERESPCFVDPAAERRVDHELHAAGFVEEPLEHERFLRRHDPERALGVGRGRRRSAPQRPARCPAAQPGYEAHGLLRPAHSRHRGTRGTRGTRRIASRRQSRAPPPRADR